jgi:TRAP-type C4-dicarboxylate transport system substrate-binding protein
MTFAAYLSFAVFTAGSAQTTLKFGAFVQEKGVSGRYVLTPFSRAVTDYSKGEARVEIFYEGKLGGTPFEQYQMIVDGRADIGYVPDLYAPDRFPDNSIFQLPNLLSSAREGSIAMWRMYEQGHLRGFEDVKVVGLYMTDPFSCIFGRRSRRRAIFREESSRSPAR